MLTELARPAPACKGPEAAARERRIRTQDRFGCQPKSNYHLPVLTVRSVWNPPSSNRYSRLKSEIGSMIRYGQKAQEEEQGVNDRVVAGGIRLEGYGLRTTRLFRGSRRGGMTLMLIWRVRAKGSFSRVILKARWKVSREGRLSASDTGAQITISRGLPSGGPARTSRRPIAKHLHSRASPDSSVDGLRPRPICLGPDTPRSEIYKSVPFFLRRR